VLVENNLDELWVGVKGQSNCVIARSPRNIFRDSLRQLHLGGRALDGLGALWATESNQTPNTDDVYPGSQTTGDKLRGREGKNPDRQLRSQNLS
jgi:hypothetical protein